MALKKDYQKDLVKNDFSENEVKEVKMESKVEDIKKWFTEKELQLEKIHAESKLPDHPPEDKIKNLLMNCIETHYGTIEGFEQKDWSVQTLKDIDGILNTIRGKLYS